MDSFESCPYGWFLRYIAKTKSEPLFYSSYGIFMHKLIEEYNKRIITRGEMLNKFLIEFSRSVKGKRPSEQIVRKYITAGANYIKTFKDFPFNVVSVEERFTWKIDNHTLTGIVDCIGEKNGNLYIVDNKSRILSKPKPKKRTTKKDEEFMSMLKQLYLYASAVKSKYGKYPKELCFNCYRKDNEHLISVEFDEKQYHSTIEWFLKEVGKIENTTDFSPNINCFKCSNICGVHNECCYYQGGDKNGF